MSHTENERDVSMKLKEEIDSQSSDESNDEGSFSGGSGRILKKGPWAPEEDAILHAYVSKHGDANWNAVQKNSGLSRCGKSCRLRWSNHLRPDLKKGPITPDEERIIIKLHAQFGNKWALMATHLPGRTDNEIKNYWNTRIKRCHRANMPVYPAEMGFDIANENHHLLDSSEFMNIDDQNYICDVLPNVPDDYPFSDQGLLSYTSRFPPINSSSMFAQGLGSEDFSFMNPSAIHSERLHASEALAPGFQGNQFSTTYLENIQQLSELNFPYWLVPTIKNLEPFTGAIHGSHALPYGNFSTSRPLDEAEKLELPSLQYTEDEIEAADAFIQSSLTTESVQSGVTSPLHSGMLEELLYEGHRLTMRRWWSERSSSSTLSTADDVFGENPPLEGSLFDEFPLFDEPSGSDGMLENAELVPSARVEEIGDPVQPDFPRVDALLADTNWLAESDGAASEDSMLWYFGDDPDIEYYPCYDTSYAF